MHNIINIRTKELKSFIEKSVGLIGKKPESVFFRTRFGIHTFGMKYPIDIVIFDNGKRVVRIKESLLPNRVFFWPLNYDCVLELPKGMIKEHNIKIGQLLELEIIS